MGFPVRPKVCVLPQRWRQGSIFGRLAHGGRLLSSLSDGDQDQVPRYGGGAVTHPPGGS